MASLKLVSILCLLIVSFTNGNGISLEATEEAIHGKPFTMKCSVNKTEKPNNVLWFESNEAVVATTPDGFDQPLGNLHSPYGRIFGRYFVTSYGPFEHHLTLLIDPNKDEGRSWACAVGKTRSNSIKIKSRAQDPPSFWTMPWIYGLAAGIPVCLLILLLPVYIWRGRS